MSDENFLKEDLINLRKELGLTQQEKTDLVGFMRNGLLDSRTLNQMAPFDRPSLMVPNGHPVDSNGYPLPDPNRPGQAQDLYMTIPSNGKIACLGERVTQVAREKRIFKVIRAAGCLTQDYDPRVSIVLRREVCQQLLYCDEIRRQPLNSALPKHVRQHSRQCDSIF